MDKFKYILLFVLLHASPNVSAGYAPAIVQDSLKSLYPSVQVVGWSTDSNYYVAGFKYNGFNMKVWFDTKGNWIMKQTDWQVMDEVPTPVWHTFTYGPYSTDQVDDVTFVEFPNHPSQIVVLISIPNALTQYQLFYTPNGTLFNARNVTYMNNILGASTFL